MHRRSCCLVTRVMTTVACVWSAQSLLNCYLQRLWILQMVWVRNIMYRYCLAQNVNSTLDRGLKYVDHLIFTTSTLVLCQYKINWSN